MTYFIHFSALHLVCLFDCFFLIFCMAFLTEKYFLPLKQLHTSFSIGKHNPFSKYKISICVVS